MLHDATPETFEPYVGSVFVVPVEGDEPVALTLVEVALLPAYDAELRPKPFRLAFEGPPARTLAQALHHMEHADLGALAVFIVPTAPGRYEAIFS